MPILQYFSPNRRWTDARVLQILLLGMFLAYGIIFLGWSRDGAIYLAAFTSCLGMQYVLATYRNDPPGSWKSATISALGLCLLLKVNDPWLMAFAGVLTISGKYFIQVNGKHVFNPTNLALVVMMFTGLGWISPGQWGSGESVGILLVIGAASVLFGVGRWDVAISFLGGLFLLESVYSIGYLGWGWDVVFHKFNNCTVLLFSFFMITDPRTSPNHRKARLIWGGLVALLSFGLSQFFYFYQSPVLALFVVSFLTPFLDIKLKNSRFHWNSTIEKPKTQTV